MELIVNPQKEQWSALCRRASAENSVIEERVAAILERIRKGGDAALREITEEIDGCAPASFLVSEEEIREAASQVSESLKSAVEAAAANIRTFHAAQMPKPLEVETIPGVKCRRRSLPIEKVGLYIPGGSAPLFSTLLMLAIPARLAGCREVILSTPCGKDGRVAPAILYAASVCGVDRIYKAGGAQAIGAMAYGTETIPRVSKIFGPGNRYVTFAKQAVSARGVQSICRQARRK